MANLAENICLFSSKSLSFLAYKFIFELFMTFPISKSLYSHLLHLPNVLRSKVVENLTETDLDSLQIAIGKGKKVVQKLVWQNLQELIVRTRQIRIYQNLLLDHPDWKVDAWSISLDEKIWLLRVYELSKLGVKIPQITETQPSPKLLSQRESVEKALKEITHITWSGLSKCPDSIRLLENLKNLFLKGDDQKGLIVPPDVRWNGNLEVLQIVENKQLTKPPNLSYNLKLRFFAMVKNQLNTPPNLRKNENLVYLYLSVNELTQAPNLDRLKKLKFFMICKNKLTVAPNVRGLKKLSLLNISSNAIVNPPDVSRNLQLKLLDISKNRMQKLPDLRHNKKLEKFFCYRNPLTDEENVNLR